MPLARVQNRWQKLTRNTDIRHAYHALALDEHRAPFSPTLWYIPHHRPHAPSSEELRRLKDDIDVVEKGKYSRKEKLRVWRRYQEAKLAYDFQLYDRTDLKQVWFPGVHINIGGGNKDGLKSRIGDLERKYARLETKAFFF